MLNKVTLKGNMGQSPKIWRTPDGREIASFPLATSKSWQNESGEWKTYTDWHRVTVFQEETVKWMKDGLKKGDTVYLEGKLTYRLQRDPHNHIRLTAYVVIAGQNGCLEYLHSRKPSEQEETIGITNPSLEIVDQTSLSHSPLSSK